MNRRKFEIIRQYILLAMLRIRLRDQKRMIAILDMMIAEVITRLFQKIIFNIDMRFYQLLVRGVSERYIKQWTTRRRNLSHLR